MENLNKENINNYVILKVYPEMSAVTNFKLLKKLYESGLYLAKVKHTIDRGSDCAFNLVDTSKNCILFLLVGDDALMKAKELIEKDKILDVEITEDLSQFKFAFHKYSDESVLKDIEQTFIYCSSNLLVDDDTIIDEISKFGIGIEKIDKEEFMEAALNKNYDISNTNPTSIFLVKGYNVYNRLNSVIDKNELLSKNVHFINPKSNINKPTQKRKNYVKSQI